MNLAITLTTTIFDKTTGHVTRKYTETSNSVVAQILWMLWAFWKAADQYGIINTAGNNTWYSRTMTATAPLANALYGIVVGTDDTPVDLEDYNLIARITEGTDAGKLNHGVMLFTQPPTVSGSSIQAKLMRVLTNNSPGDITIKEVGLVITDYGTYFLIDRTVPTPKTLTPTEGTSIEYTFSITV